MPIEIWKNIGLDAYENEFMVGDHFSLLLGIYNARLTSLKKITIYQNGSKAG